MCVWIGEREKGGFDKKAFCEFIWEFLFLPEGEVLRLHGVRGLYGEERERVRF